MRRRAWVRIDECPMALAAEIVGDRWVLLVLRESAYGVVRFDDMLSDLGAPRSVLTQRLKRMVGHGLLERQAYREPGERQRYAYVLTEKGRGLLLALAALADWGETHLLSTESPVVIKKHAGGARLRAGLVDRAGRRVALEDATLTRP